VLVRHHGYSSYDNKVLDKRKILSIVGGYIDGKFFGSWALVNPLFFKKIKNILLNIKNYEKKSEHSQQCNLQARKILKRYSLYYGLHKNDKL
jgi:hypothetical protein